MGPRCRHSTRVALQLQYAIPCSISLPTVQHAFYPYCTSGLTSPLLYPQCILHSTHTALPVYRHTVCVISAHCAAVVCASSMKIMVEEISKTITQYEERLRRCSYAPRLSYGRRMLAEDGGPNAMFFTVLFCDEPMACATASQCDVPRWSSRCLRISFIIYCRV